MAKWWDRWNSAHRRARAASDEKRSAKRAERASEGQSREIAATVTGQSRQKSRFWAAFDRIDRFS